MAPVVFYSEPTRKNAFRLWRACIMARVYSTFIVFLLYLVCASPCQASMTWNLQPPARTISPPPTDEPTPWRALPSGQPFVGGGWIQVQWQKAASLCVSGGAFARSEHPTTTVVNRATFSSTWAAQRATTAGRQSSGLSEPPYNRPRPTVPATIVRRRLQPRLCPRSATSKHGATVAMAGHRGPPSAGFSAHTHLLSLEGSNDFLVIS